MALDLKQEARLTQQLVLTPQLQQAIKLLQLNRLELEAAIKEELSTNPMLEEVEEAPLGPSGPEPEGVPWSGTYLSPRRPSRRKDPFEEGPALEDLAKSETTLQDHLLWQLRMAALDDEALRIGSFLIGNIDDDGYLRVSVKEVAQRLGCKEETVEEVLKVIQGFDPPGVGARDLRECLLIQIRQREDAHPLLYRIVADGFEDLLKGDLRSLADRLGVETDEVLRALEVLKTLDTKPGRAFTSDASIYVIPDVIIYKKGDDYEVMLNDEGLPRLRLSAQYQRLLKEGTDEKCRSYLRQKLKEAQWFLRGLEQRQRTLERITRSICKFQREFLDKGVEYLKPMVLRDVAEDTGLHESTVSRAIAGKYAWTPQGLYELKFFFSSRVGDGLVEMSSTKVKKLIEDLIAQEDRRCPLSDQEISRILKERYGLRIARRTVTKYREALGIPSSKERRVIL